MQVFHLPVKSHQFASDNAAELDNWVAVLNNAIDFNRLHGGGLAVPLPNSLIIDPNATEPLDNRTVRGQSSVPLYNARKVTTAVPPFFSPPFFNYFLAIITKLIK